MQLKLTSRFLLAVLAVFGVLVMTNVCILLYLLFQQNTQQSINTLSSPAIEQFTRQLDEHVMYDDGSVSFPDDVFAQLETFHAWLQVVDFSGNVVYSYNVPEDVLTSYRPVDFVQTYRYQEQVNTTTFFGDGQRYNYIVGVVNPNVERIILTYENESVMNVLRKLFIAITIINIAIIMIAGWLFSHPLTRPIARMTQALQLLETKKTLPPQKKSGLYAPVFANLQSVSHKLARAEEERLQLETMREEWISNVSHDLKTPLASIRGYAELLNSANVTEDERLDYASTIERQAEHMKNLLDDFNLTMRLRHQQLPMTTERINFVSFVREMVIDLLNDPSAAERHIEFDAPDVEVMKNIDSHYMRRALLNFLYNAITHNRSDVAIFITMTEDGTLSIRDNGNGIKEQDVAHIFERYYRGTNTASTDGTGLGMAIARDIIEAHGGSVSLISKEHVGTTITVKLPIIT
ncbi:MAG: HAMP domain-containing histidine kinase [Caryophanon sp.]|nr:HAMP domain-containing histidine kinase [Caryophanon sp.]